MLTEDGGEVYFTYRPSARMNRQRTGMEKEKGEWGRGCGIDVDIRGEAYRRFGEVELRSGQTSWIAAAGDGSKSGHAEY